MELLRGETIAKGIKSAVAAEVQRLSNFGIWPKMAAVVASSDAGVLSYVRAKVRIAANLGIALEVVDLGSKSTQIELERRIAELGADPSIHGILLEMPLAEGINQNRILDMIPAGKDIEGLGCTNLGKIISGRESEALLPATPLACILMAESVGPLAGKRVGVIGRGKTVGRPLIGMLLNRDVTPTICHTRTANLAAVLRGCEIIIVAIGRANLITDAYVHPGQIIIDAGINVVNGKITGDVDFALVERAGVCALTPVPGGVGPITSVLIFRNLLKAVIQQNPNLTT